MTDNSFYYGWFQKIIEFFIELFFVAAVLASLYVLTSFLNGTIRIIVFIVTVVFYLAVIYLLKDKIRKLLEKLIDHIRRLELKQMMIIILLSSLILKVLCTILFNFDATTSGDVEIYDQIADQIVKTGDIHSDAISHLYGVALHFVLFKLLGLPLHVGLYIVFTAGTIINFFSFEEMIGKDKAFMAVMAYLLMPSTVFMSFCPTHEIFVYLYISLFLFVFNRLLKEESLGKTLMYGFLCVLSTVLTCFVNPGGYIIYIIMVLSIVLSNLVIRKKAIIALCLILSVFCSNNVSKFLNVNEYTTTINTYTILIHGTNPESLGEQVDGYPLKQMRKYIYENTLDFSENGFVDAAKNVFISQCLHLLSHPVTLVRLVIHKIYILWSGVHYPLELANFYGALKGILYYAFLALSTLIYLSVLSFGLLFHKKTDNDFIAISNYKLELLGVVGLTMFCIVANKYSIYVTLFIYLIALYRSFIGEENAQER